MGNQGNKGKSKKQDKFEKDEKKEQQKKRADGSDMEEKQIETELIRETGAISLERNKQHHRIELLTIIGEIEGHDVLSGNTKATKYEHIKEQSLIQKQPSKSEGCFCIYARKAHNIRLSGLFLFSGDLVD